MSAARCYEEHNEHALMMMMVDSADEDNCRTVGGNYLFTLGCCECLNTNVQAKKDATSCPKEERVLQPRAAAG